MKPASVVLNTTAMIASSMNNPMPTEGVGITAANDFTEFQHEFPNSVDFLMIFVELGLTVSSRAIVHAMHHS